MRLCKYRELPAGDEESLRRTLGILSSGGFWCAAPAELNDDEEFIWQRDYSPTPRTASLLARILPKSMAALDAAMAANKVLAEGRLEGCVQPVLEAMMAQCRREVGVACFCTHSDNSTMWDRYADCGSGVCIEVDAPDSLLYRELHPIRYEASKVIHVDSFLGSLSDHADTETMYRMSFLTKVVSWAPESEVRFVSKSQNVLVRISDSRISRLILGQRLDADVAARIEEHVRSLPYEVKVCVRGG
jgi:hypothetical protein